MLTLKQEQIEALKKKCPECNHDRKGFFNEWDRVIKKTSFPELCICKGTGKQLIEIEKEWEKIGNFGQQLRLKHKIGDEIKILIENKVTQKLTQYYSIFLKIISENPKNKDEWLCCEAE